MWREKKGRQERGTQVTVTIDNRFYGIEAGKIATRNNDLWWCAIDRSEGEGKIVAEADTRDELAENLKGKAAREGCTKTLVANTLGFTSAGNAAWRPISPDW